MTEVDILRMKRRNLQVEAKRLEEKLYMLKEEMRKMDSRIDVYKRQYDNLPKFKNSDQWDWN